MRRVGIREDKLSKSKSAWLSRMVVAGAMLTGLGAAMAETIKAGVANFCKGPPLAAAVNRLCLTTGMPVPDLKLATGLFVFVMLALPSLRGQRGAFRE